MREALRINCRTVAKRCLGEEGLSFLLLFLFLALFLGPFLDPLPTRPLTTLVLSLVMVTGVANMTHGAVARGVAGLLALAAIVLRGLTHLVPSTTLECWSRVVSFLFMVGLTAVILFRVFTTDRPVTGNLVRGAVAAYLLFGITWSMLYTLVDQGVPGAFALSSAAAGAERQERFVYYSFVTLTTVGYGDITPTHDISRICAVVEALVGQLYPATLLARLVSLQVSHRENRPPKGDGQC